MKNPWCAGRVVVVGVGLVADRRVGIGDGLFQDPLGRFDIGGRLAQRRTVGGRDRWRSASVYGRPLGPGSGSALRAGAAAPGKSRVTASGRARVVPRAVLTSGASDPGNRLGNLDVKPERRWLDLARSRLLWTWENEAGMTSSDSGRGSGTALYVVGTSGTRRLFARSRAALLSAGGPASTGFEAAAGTRRTGATRGRPRSGQSSLRGGVRHRSLASGRRPSLASI